MRKIVKKIIYTFVIFLACYSYSFASDISNKYFNISLPEGYIDLKEVIDKNNNELANEYGIDIKVLKEFYTKNNVILDFITNDLQNEIMITTSVTDYTKNVTSINTLNENEYIKLKENFLNSKNNQNIEILDSKDYTYNNNKYIHTTIRTDNEIQNKVTTSSQFYTIINKVAYTISISKVNQELNQEEIDNLLNSIKYNNYEALDKDLIKNYVIAFILVILVYGLGLLISYIIKKVRNLHKLNENNKSITYKIYGYHLVFIISSIIMTLFYLYNIYFTINNLIYIDMSNNIYKYIITALAIIQNIIQTFFVLYVILLATKKKESVLDKIIKYLNRLFIISIGFFILRNAVTFIMFGFSVSNIYFIQELFYLCFTLIYAFTWFKYFKMSNRIKVFFSN